MLSEAASHQSKGQYRKLHHYNVDREGIHQYLIEAYSSWQAAAVLAMREDIRIKTQLTK